MGLDDLGTSTTLESNKSPLWLYPSVPGARRILTNWQEEYNGERPHNALEGGYHGYSRRHAATIL